jgi:hypothetical protein
MDVIHLSAISKVCHSEPFAVILSEAKDLALAMQLGHDRANQGEIPRFARNDIPLRDPSNQNTTASRVNPSETTCSNPAGWIRRGGAGLV